MYSGMDRIAIPDSVDSAEAVLARAEREMIRQKRKKRPKPATVEPDDSAEPCESGESHDLDELA
jgi:hypothetical protein